MTDQIADAITERLNLGVRSERRPAAAERELQAARAELERVTAERDRLVEAIGRLHSLPPQHIAKAYSVTYGGTTAAVPGSPSRAQEPDPDRIAQAIGDPGSIVGRRRGPSWGEGNDGYAPEHESVTRWATRAVRAVLAVLSRGEDGDTPPAAVDALTEERTDG